MGYLSNVVIQGLMNHVFGVSAYTPAASLYLALHTSDPGHSGSSECVYDGYTGAIRPVMSFASASVKSSAHSDITMSFPMCLSGLETATHFGIWDSPTAGAGNFIGGGTLTSPLVISGGNLPDLNGGDLTVSLDDFPDDGISITLANKLLNFVLKNTLYTQPTIELSLHTSDSTSAVPGVECTGTNYARLATPDWDSAVIDPSYVYTKNTLLAQFASPSDDTWGTITGLGIFDSVTLDMLFFYNGIPPTPVLTGVAVEAAIGAIEIRLS